MSKGEEVFVWDGQVPEDYHCTCRYCQEVIGELRRPDGTYYSRLERREYYDPAEQGVGGHIAKTPLHVARWAVQRFTSPGDWVLDPTLGSGTTAVEALTQGRNAAGMELQFDEVLRKNLLRHLVDGGPMAMVRAGDARNIREYLDEIGKRFHLVVSNPPYSGDESDGGIGAGHPMKGAFRYRDGLPNLAFLREGPEYWEAMREIYSACAERLARGGFFVTGIKDMMRQKRPYLLHHQFCELLSGVGLEFHGTAFLRHHPGTLHLYTYEKRHGVAPPRYQTISVFRRA